MVKFVPIMIALILTGMFTIALLYGGILFQITNDAPVKITDDPEIANLSTDISSSLGETSNNLNSADQSFSNSTITTTGVIPYVNAISGVWQVIKKGPTLGYNIISTFIFDKLLGGDPTAFVIVSALAAILMLIVISAVVYMVSRGEAG